jgi:hypothetical protein
MLIVVIEDVGIFRTADPVKKLTVLLSVASLGSNRIIINEDHEII